MKNQASPAVSVDAQYEEFLRNVNRRFLKPKGDVPVSDLNTPVITMTWSKFRDTVIPGADSIELFVDSNRDNYSALVTAVHPDSPPILQWDRADCRNPVSWYVWQGGSAPSQIGLKHSQYHAVDAIALNPSKWVNGDDCPHIQNDVFFVIRGAKESRQAGNALFPECLKSELHGVRSVVEAYSRSATIAGLNEPHAAGLMAHRGGGS